MNKQEIRDYVNNFNDLTNINSIQYRKVWEILTQTGNINDPEIRELIYLAKNKGIIR